MTKQQGAIFLFSSNEMKVYISMGKILVHYKMKRMCLTISFYWPSYVVCIINKFSVINHFKLANLKMKAILNHIKDLFQLQQVFLIEVNGRDRELPDGNNNPSAISDGSEHLTPSVTSTRRQHIQLLNTLILCVKI